jgi:acyl phosphate:glycerol-3-phosphate acyltransferase
MFGISITLLSIPVAAYLLGSIPFGLLLARLLCGMDVRKAGSGNIGATNVARAAGPVAGILTLLLDAAKGAFAVLLAARLSGDSSTWMMIAAMASLIGHCYPIWLNFHGGKGVATAAGFFLVLSPMAFGIAITIFIVVAVFTRFVSLGSISAAAAMPLLIYLLWAPRHAPPPTVTFGALAVSLLILYKHDANIQRLVNGEEPKFSFSKKKDAE